MRPATLGELLDRAVTLFVPNAWIFVALSAILYLPIGLAQLTLGNFWTWYLTVFTKAITSPGSAVAMDQQLLQRLGPVEAFTFALTFFVTPLVVAACAHVAFRRIEGEPVSIGESLRFALPRYGRVMLFVLVWIAALVILMFGITFTLGLMAAAISAVLHSVAVIAIIAIAIFAAVVMGMLLAIISGGVGLMVAINEPQGAIAAFAAGIVRTVNRKMFWRSVLAALLLFAISLGFSTITTVAGFSLLVATHSGVPLVIINSAVAMVQFGFMTVFLAVFYADLRVRREGADLEALASRLPA